MPKTDTPPGLDAEPSGMIAGSGIIVRLPSGSMKPFGSSVERPTRPYSAAIWSSDLTPM